MNLLLDSHALLWWLADDRRLGPEAREAVAEAGNAVWVSVASLWEIAVKSRLGRLDLGEPPAVCLPPVIERGGFRVLPVEMAHALAVYDLPHHHADPFDRLLIAQARLERLDVVTADRAFSLYDVPIVPAER